MPDGRSSTGFSSVRGCLVCDCNNQSVVDKTLMEIIKDMENEEQNAGYVIPAIL